MNYILSQIFIILCYAMIGVSYLAKNRKAVLIYSLISVVLNGLSYFLLSAWTGLAMIGVAIIRNILFMIQDKMMTSHRFNENKIKIFKNITLALLIVISIIFAVITYNQIFSLFAVLSTLMYTYALWQDKVSSYRVFGLVAEISGLVYCAFIHSIFGVILELVVIIVSVINLIKHYKQNLLDKKEV